VAYEWAADKNAGNFSKHRIWFADAVPVLEDEYAVTVSDTESDPSEERFVTLGMDAFARILVVVFTYRDQNIRLISARRAEPHERQQYEEQL